MTYYLYRSAAVPSLANCSADCTQLGCDWFTVTDDVCVCGHDASIIHCEEEIGPVVEVFCIEKEKVHIYSGLDNCASAATKPQNLDSMKNF